MAAKKDISPQSKQYAEKMAQLAYTLRKNREDEFMSFYELVQTATNDYDRDVGNLILRNLAPGLADSTKLRCMVENMHAVDSSWTTSFRDRKLTVNSNKELYDRIVEQRKNPEHRKLLGLPKLEDACSK